jgi:hypothetical protein
MGVVAMNWSLMLKEQAKFGLVEASGGTDPAHGP